MGHRGSGGSYEVDEMGGSCFSLGGRVLRALWGGAGRVLDGGDGLTGLGDHMGSLGAVQTPIGLSVSPPL